jgi:hypothetical protein
MASLPFACMSLKQALVYARGNFAQLFVMAVFFTDFRPSTNASSTPLLVP